jgi:hypothetical protein
MLSFGKLASAVAKQWRRSGEECVEVGTATTEQKMNVVLSPGKSLEMELRYPHLINSHARLVANHIWTPWSILLDVHAGGDITCMTILTQGTSHLAIAKGNTAPPMRCAHCTLQTG